MPYAITQYYLSPACTPAEAGTRISNPGRMQGWVENHPQSILSRSRNNLWLLCGALPVMSSSADECVISSKCLLINISFKLMSTHRVKIVLVFTSVFQVLPPIFPTVCSQFMHLWRHLEEEYRYVYRVSLLSGNIRKSQNCINRQCIECGVLILTTYSGSGRMHSLSRLLLILTVLFHDHRCRNCDSRFDIQWHKLIYQSYHFCTFRIQT